MVAVDELRFFNPMGAKQIESSNQDGGLATGETDLLGLVRFDFEPPHYLVGRDVVGTEGWEVSSFGSPPATSVSRTSGSQTPPVPVAA